KKYLLCSSLLWLTVSNDSLLHDLLYGIGNLAFSRDLLSMRLYNAFRKNRFELLKKIIAFMRKNKQNRKFIHLFEKNMSLVFRKIITEYEENQIRDKEKNIIINMLKRSVHLPAHQDKRVPNP
ncbi:MAG: hypothetical protein ACOCWO_04665, partial [Candidatus Muiribacteriaceae bacterium]